jgi:tetratricopeptide (TPR) repeat protein
MRLSLLVLLLLAGMSPLACLSQTPGREDAFTEAQRYHLGINRPRNAKKAAELYKQAIRENPRNNDARYNLAHLYFVRKRYDLAAKSYREVLRLDPEDADAYNNLGTIYERQGKIKAAAKLYLKATKTERPVPAAYYNLARYYMEEGSEERAQKAIALEPENEQFIKLHSKLLGDLGRLSDATIGYVVAGLVVTLAGGSVVLYKGKFIS